MRARGLAAAGLGAALFWGAMALAQSQVTGFPLSNPFPGAAILIVDQERLLTESRLGRDIFALNNAEAEALRAEGAALDRQFEEEERQLANRRASMTPAEFRTLADAFDEKVVRTRAEQQEKSAALAQRLENRRIDFFQQVAPVLAGILSETGAAAIVDERATLISNEDLNITDEVIKRLDEAFLDGQAGGTETEERDD